MEKLKALVRHKIETGQVRTISEVAELARGLGLSGFRIETVSGGVKAQLWGSDAKTYGAVDDSEFLARLAAIKLFIESDG